MKKRIFSGIQPTGIIHIGNYFGAIENWIKLLDNYECFFCIVDYHAITIDYEPAGMQEHIIETVKTNIAAGLSPQKCTILVQSAVPEHTELAWLFNCVTPLGELERMTQFKEKSQQHRHNINAGLLNYPVLQAADIALYKAEAVPVGEDQAQHLELTREIIRRFNKRFGETFPEPQTLIGRGGRIMGLDGKTKMSKSLNNYIALMDPPEAVWRKLAPAVTDENRKRRSDPGNSDICNIFSIHKLVTDEKVLQEVADGCRTASIGCLDCKKALAENLNALLAPIQARKKELDDNPKYVDNVLKEGNEKAKNIAVQTIRETKQKMGLI